MELEKELLYCIAWVKIANSAMVVTRFGCISHFERRDLTVAFIHWSWCRGRRECEDGFAVSEKAR